MTQIFGEIQMAFTSANDINILQASDAAVVGAGLGDDTYVLSPSTLSANQVIRISDAQGANKLQLIGGLTIASSTVASNAVLLTLSNGAKVTVLGADTFSYEVGGNPLTGTAGTVQTYAQFATTTLGAASVPAAGASPVSGSTDVTIPGGSTGGGAGQAFTLTTTAESKTLTAGNDTVDGSSVLDSISGDTIIDASTTDTDTLNVLINGSINPNTVANVENVNVTAKYGAATVTAGNYSGVKNLVLDSAIASGVVSVTGTSATNIASVKASTNVSTLTVTSGASGTGSGVAVDAGAASSVTLTGVNTKTDVIDLTLNGGATSVTATTLGDSTDKLTVKALTSANTVTFTGTAAGAKTLVVSGGQNVTLKGDSNVFTANTLTNSLDSGKTLDLVITASTSASPDLSKVSASSIELQAINTGATFAENAKVKLNTTSAAALNAATSATTLNVDLLKATTGALTQGTNPWTTVNFTANTVDVTSLNADLDGAATMKLSGAKKVTLATTSQAKVVDALGLTAALTATADDELFDIKGGSGDDVITIAAGTNFDAAADTTNIAVSLLLGTGNDKLVLGGLTAATDTDTTYVFDGGTGSNTLQLTGSADFEGTTGYKPAVLTGFSAIDLGTNTLTLTQKQLFTNGSAFTLSGNTGTLAIKDDGSSSKVFNISGIVFTPGETQTITMDGHATDANTMTGSAAADSITGGAGKDTIVAGGGNDTITGGDGADTINFNAGTDTYKHDALNDSYVGDIVSGTTVISASVDVVTGAGNNDVFNFALTTALGGAITGEAATTTLLTTPTGTTSNIDIIRGTYNGSVFTVGNTAADDDYMFQVVDAEAGAADTLHSVVLLDVVGTVTFNSTTAGVVTLLVA